MLTHVSQIPQIDVWFRSEVSRWRSGAALVWTVALTTPIVYLTLTIANISFLHPFQWICSSVLQVFTSSTWPYTVFITLATAMLAVQSSKQFTVVPTLYSTRLERYTHVVRLSSLYYLACSSVLCGTVAWSYTGLVQGQYHKLSRSCDDKGDSTCLNEHHLFIVMHGICLGACYKLSSLLSGNSHLVFPIIQQSKFFQMKISAFPLVMNCILRSLHHLKYFYIVYYLVLGTTVQQCARNVGLSLSASITPINSISGMLDMSLLWHTTLSGTLILSLLSLSARLFKLYHTEYHEFPIETSMEQYKHLCLNNALSCQRNDFVQYLGYQDLYRLSKHSPARRQQIFCLTQLGGHPQNWSSLSKQCLALLKDFVEEVKAYNVKAMADGSMKHLTGEGGLIQGSSGTSGLRQRNGTNETAHALSEKPTKPTTTQMLITDLKKKKLIAYFMAEDPDVCSRKLFARAQLYLWAVDALSHLTCASYTEDKFGVVQKSLPEIIETLLHLQEQVDKHYRLMSNIGKRPETDDDTDTALRNSLKTTLKAAIYRIITTFDSHVRSVPLSGDNKRRLNHFLDYKE